MITSEKQAGATSRPSEIDPVTFEIAAAGLQSAAEEMGSALKRSSYSPIIRDMDDFSCAIFTVEGDLVAQADYIPAQLGAMSLVVKSILNRWEGKIQVGDVYICNHPYLGAMHLPDINIVTPVFRDGRLFAWTGTAAHHIDVGGVNPGSEGPELQELFGEGLILPPIRLYIAGEENDDVISLLHENIRDPRSTVSDLRAQRAACRLGGERVHELADRYGDQKLSKIMSEMLSSVERGVRAALASLPDGEGEAEGFLDDDGRDGNPTRVHVRVKKVGDQLEIDLSGSDKQTAGAMNVPWASARAGIVYAVRAVIATDLGANDGLLRAVTVNAPSGIVLNPVAPAAVSIRHNTCQRFADTLIRAFADVWPEKAVGSSSVSFFCFNVGSTDPFTGRTAVMADVVGGGTGASQWGDGIDGVDTYMSNVGVMPAEVVETNYQVRVLKNEFIPGSQGLRKFNGGMGIRREYEILDHDQRVTFYSEQTHPDFKPRGAAGGGDATETTITIVDVSGKERRAPSKSSTTLNAGTVLRVETAGGGGFGTPNERPSDLVQSDEHNERLATRSVDPDNNKA